MRSRPVRRALVASAACPGRECGECGAPWPRVRRALGARPACPGRQPGAHWSPARSALAASPACPGRSSGAPWSLVRSAPVDRSACAGHRLGVCAAVSVGTCPPPGGGYSDEPRASALCQTHSSVDAGDRAREESHQSPAWAPRPHRRGTTRRRPGMTARAATEPNRPARHGAPRAPSRAVPSGSPLRATGRTGHPREM